MRFTRFNLWLLIIFSANYSNDPEIYVGKFSSERMVLVKIMSDDVIASSKIFIDPLIR